jgi:hypothetical protein
VVVEDGNAAVCGRRPGSVVVGTGLVGGDVGGGPVLGAGPAVAEVGTGRLDAAALDPTWAVVEDEGDTAIPELGECREGSTMAMITPATTSVASTATLGSRLVGRRWAGVFMGQWRC